jgi:hypothetical protein
MDAHWRIELFGGLRAVQAAPDVTRFRTRKAGGLLACLSGYLDRSHARDVLTGQLWPRCDPPMRPRAAI